MHTDYSETLPLTSHSLWASGKVLVTHLDMELTERCNFHCCHCYIRRQKNDADVPKKEMRLEEIQRILSEAAALGCLTVRFTGGEPLLREDFPDIYLFARKLGIRVMVFTNASLITPDLVKLFRRIPPMEKIEVSVYGMSDVSYNSVTRTMHSFADAFRGMNLLLEAGIPFVVKTTLLPQNREDLETFRRWSKTIPWMASDLPVNLFLHLSGRHDDSEKMSAAISKLRLTSDDILRFTLENHPEWREEMKHYMAAFAIPPISKLFTCSGDRSVSVDAYGNYQFCLMLRHPETVMHYSTISLREAVENFFPALYQKTASSADFLKRCGKCFIRSICEQCPAKSYTEYGVLDRPVDYYCNIAHVQAGYLGLLGSNEKAWNVTDGPERLRRFTQS